MRMKSFPEERQKILTKLRNEGNHNHNNKVLKAGRGEIQVVYRSSSTSQLSHHDYVPCCFCLGWYVKPELWKHVKRCTLNESKAQSKTRSHKRIGHLLKELPAETSAQYKKVLNHMRQDDLYLIIRNDKLLSKYGEQLTNRFGHDPNKFVNITSRLRMMARLLKAMRQIDSNITQIEDSMNPEMFDTILSAARLMTGFDRDSNLYSNPSLALKVGTTFCRVVNILHSFGIEQKDETIKMKCHDLQRLFSMRWTEEFTFHAHRTNTKNKKNKIILVPLAEDVTKLATKLRKDMEQACDDLNALNSESHASLYIGPYRTLQKSLLALIILFNRKRTGEVGKMKVEEYLSKKKGATAFTLEALRLDALEQEFARSFTRVELEGKKGKTVAMFLCNNMKKGMDLLLDYRRIVGIPKSNPHMFATIGSDTCLRGAQILKEYSTICGLARPEAMKGGNLRKQVAIMSAVINFDENEQDVLATWLAHDIRVHRDYYRLPDSHVQLAKMTKFLCALEKGELHNYHGKTLDDIEIPNDELEGMCIFKNLLHS